MDKQKSGQTIRPVIISVILVVAATIGLMNQTLLNIALPYISQDLGITPNMAQWLTTGFVLAIGVTTPIVAFLIGRYSTRKLFITTMMIFLAGTTLAAFSSGFVVLMTGRLMQGISVGIIMIIAQTVIAVIFPIEKRGMVLGMIGIATGLGVGLAPVVAGWILSNFQWSILLIIFIPLILLVIIAAIKYFPNLEKLQRKSNIDILSMVLSSLGFGAIVYGFSMVGSSGWSSNEVIFGLIIGVISISLFVWRQLVMTTPLLDLRLFKNITFTLSTVICMVVMIAMLGAQLLLPFYLIDVRGFTSLASGIVFLPGAIVMAIMAPIGGRLFDRYGARWLAITGLTILIVTSLMFTNLSITTSLIWIAIVYAMMMLINSLVLMPVLTAGLNQLSTENIAQGSSINNTLRQVAAAIGSGILITIMTGFTKSGEASSIDGMLQGLHMAFIAVAIIGIIALFLSFFLKSANPKVNLKKESITSSE